MNYQALYRKYRPQTFDDVKGQDVIVRTLRNQVKTERIAHAYLFCGSRGTGKTSCAKILGKAINCVHPVEGNPCGECESCRAIEAGTSMNLIEMDAASRNGVDDFRRIIDEIAYPPAEGKRKVYIIDEVHMLSTAAFNAFLKTLEEPPEYAVFLLATTDPQRLLPTVLSRCQRYDFKRIPSRVIAERLREVLELEQVEAQEEALRTIARRAEGGMRDALSIADQCVSFFPGEELTHAHVLEVLGAARTQVYRDMLHHAVNGNAAALLMTFDTLLMDGKDVRQIIGDLTWYLRDLLLFQASGASDGIEDLTAEDRQTLLQDADRVSEQQLMYYIEQLSELAGALRNAGNRRVLTEITLISLCRPQTRTGKDTALLARLDRIEHQLEEGVAVAAARADGGNTQIDQAQEIKKEELPTAIAPELFQRIAGQWKATLSHLENRGWGELLAEVGKPLFEPGDDGTLYIRLKEQWVPTFHNNEDAARMIAGAIEAKYQARIRVRFVGERESSDGRLSAIALKVRELGEDIHFDVEVEESV